MAVPRAAATVLVLSESTATAASVTAGGPCAEAGSLFKVLMIKRHSKARFMANTYVFPGGCVDAGDSDVAAEQITKLNLQAEKVSLPEYRVAALRELQEETALTVDASGRASTVADNFSSPNFSALNTLVPYAHWVTPKQEGAGSGKYRYDTRFFLCPVQDNADTALPGVKGDPKEVADVKWVSPAQALELHSDPEEKSFNLPPPTAMLLNYLSSYNSAKELVEAYKGRFDRTTGTEDAKKAFALEQADGQVIEPSATPNTNLTGVELMPRVEPVLDLKARPTVVYMKQHWTHIPVGTFPTGPKSNVTVLESGKPLPDIPAYQPESKL